MSRSWEDQEYWLNGEFKFKAPVIPPAIKALVIDGLRKKELTWEYLVANEFFHYATATCIPTHRLADTVRQMKLTLRGGIKSHVNQLFRDWIVSFWKHDMRNNSAAQCLLRELGMTDLENVFDYSFMGHLTTRHFTHLLNTECGCFECRRDEFRSEEQQSRWEAVRKVHARRGVDILSWAEHSEAAKEHYDDPTLWYKCLTIIEANKTSVFKSTNNNSNNSNSNHNDNNSSSSNNNSNNINNNNNKSKSNSNSKVRVIVIVIVIVIVKVIFIVLLIVTNTN